MCCVEMGFNDQTVHIIVGEKMFHYIYRLYIFQKNEILHDLLYHKFSQMICEQLDANLIAFIFSFLRENGMGGCLVLTCKTFREVLMEHCVTSKQEDLSTLNIRAARCGYLGVLKYYSQLKSSTHPVFPWNRPDKRARAISMDTLRQADKCGQWDVGFYLNEQGIEWPWRIEVHAIQQNRLDILKRLPNITPGSLRQAIRCDCSKEMLTYLLRRVGTFKKFALYAASTKGNLEVCQWLLTQGVHWEPFTGFMAAEKGHQHILQWAVDHSYKLDGSACDGAAKGGYLKMVQWLYNLKYPVNAVTCMHAAGSGNLELVQWLRSPSVQCPWNTRACAMAANGGYLPMLQWLRTQTPPCPWDKETCINAAQKGYLPILKYAYENGCPTNMQVGANAAAHRHLDCLRYIYAQEGTLLPHPTYHDACGKLDCLKLLNECGYRWDSDFCQNAVRFNSLECLKFLREHGARWDPWGIVYCKAIGHGNMEILRYAYENGCPLTEEVPSKAAAVGDLEVLKWLRTLPRGQCPWDLEIICLDAVKQPHILTWLRKNESFKKLRIGALKAFVKSADITVPIPGSGKKGRLLKKDYLAAIETI